jgi:hypothetical protein
MKNSQESPRSNRAIVAEINQPATPESGARSNAGKDSTDELDSRRRIGKLPKAHQVKTATEDNGAAKRAREKQIDGNRIPVFKRGDFEETL